MQTHTHMKHTHKKTQTQSLTHGISPLDITHSHTHSQTHVMGSLSVVSRQVLRTDTRGTRVCVSVGTLVYCVYCTLLHCNTRGQSSGSCFQTSTENWRMRNSHICLALHVTQYLMPIHHTLSYAQYVCTYMPRICLALHVTQHPKERVHTSYATVCSIR